QKCVLLFGKQRAAAGLVLNKVEPACQPKLHEQEILGIADAFRFLLQRTGDKTGQIAGPVPPHAAQAAVCAWADAAILTAVPVKQVVPAAVARARKVADLILFIPGRLKPPDRIKIEI